MNVVFVIFCFGSATPMSTTMKKMKTNLPKVENEGMNVSLHFTKQFQNVNAHKRIIHMRKSYHSLKVALQTAMGLMGLVVVAMELTGPLVAVEVLVFLFVSLIASSVHVHKTFELAACCCR